MKKVYLIAAALVFFVITNCSISDESGGSSDDGNETTPVAATRKDLIIEKWIEYRPLSGVDRYLTAPSVSAVYSAGELDPYFLSNGLNMMNFVRFLSGLPDDLVLDAALNNAAQHGAVLLAVVDQLTHTPSKPDDMDDDFFNTGSASVQFSHISQGYISLESSIRYGYMPDTGTEDTLGHRRLILKPSLKKIGFGFAYKNSNFSVLEIMDSSRVESVSYDFIAWPGVDAFPVEFFSDDQLWSVILNPSLYSAPALDSIVVVLTRLSDGKTWILDQNDNAYVSGSEYFNVNTDPYYGVSNCIIFKPDNQATCNDGDKYEVTISGMSYITGQAAEIKFEVEFFNLPQ